MKTRTFSSGDIVERRAICGLQQRAYPSPHGSIYADLGGRTIRIGVENAYPPFNFIDESDRPAGRMGALLGGTDRPVGVAVSAYLCRHRARVARFIWLARATRAARRISAV